MRQRAWSGIICGRIGDPNRGRIGDPYVLDCRHIDRETGCDLIFSRDSMWKGPDYEFCWHLSISPLQVGFVREFTISAQRAWVAAFFRDNERLLWLEGQYSDVGKAHEVNHWRLFVSEDWLTPILPRGEVYSKLGWKSWSELHG